VFENKCVLACDSATRRPDKKQACGPLNLVGIKCTALAVAVIMLEGKGRQLADSAHRLEFRLEHSPANKADLVTSVRARMCAWGEKCTP
jgi:hypothetical protein